jgi:hypothetical protein
VQGRAGVTLRSGSSMSMPIQVDQRNALCVLMNSPSCQVTQEADISSELEVNADRVTGSNSRSYLSRSLPISHVRDDRSSRHIRVHGHHARIMGRSLASRLSSRTRDISVWRLGRHGFQR